MNKLITIAVMTLAVLPIWAQQTKKFTLKCTTHPQAKTVSLISMTSKDLRIDNIAVSSGEFTLAVEAPDGDVMVVQDRNNRMRGVFVADAPEISLDMNKDSAAGSAMNEKMSQVVRDIAKLSSVNAAKEYLKKTLPENKDNVVGAYIFGEFYSLLDYQELKEALTQNEYLARHPLAAFAMQHLKGLELRAPGTKFKDIKESDPNGKTHKLSEYVGKGNYVLVDFWASWCGPCMQEMPNVKANFEKYKEKGFNVVGLSFDRAADPWKKAIEEKGLNWTHLSDLKFWQTAAAETYGIQSIPASILCDPKGIIVAIDLRGETLGNKLKEIYGF